MNYIGYNTIITDTLMGRSIAVNKINGYSLYINQDELGNLFLYTLKEEDVFGKTHTFTDCVGRSYGNMTYEEFFKGFENRYAEYKENI